MHIRTRYVAVVVALGLGLAGASCDKKAPTSPPPVPQPGPTPVPTVRVELLAPAEIAPGELVQLTANAIKSDGSVENVSSQARWTSSDVRVLEISSTGLATAKSPGGVSISVSFLRLGAGRQILVLPPGTFRLTGTLRESGTAIANATVTVLSGRGAGLTTLSSAFGQYNLYGVSGPVQIQVKKEGYVTATQQVDVYAHGTRNFDLLAERPRKDYRGAYTLTISAGPPCITSTSLPDDAKRRVYTANIAQDVGRLTVTLTDADFIVTNGVGNRFLGFVDVTDGVMFAIGDDYYYSSAPFDIVERFSATALIVNGIVTAKATAQGVSGVLRGYLLIASRPSFPFTPFSSTCSSNTHGFEMVRR